MKIKGVFVMGVLLMICHQVMGQEYNPFIDKYTEVVKPNPIRVVLNKFSWSVYTGIGAIQYQSVLPNGYTLSSTDDQLYVSPFDSTRTEFPVGDSIDVTADWLHAPNTIRYGIQENDKTLHTDSIPVELKGMGTSIPLMLSVHYNLFDRFRLGLGASFALHYLSKVSPGLGDTFTPHQPGIKRALVTKFFGYGGGKLYQWADYSYYLDLQFGSYKLGNPFDAGALQQSKFVNIGIPIEKAMSEYFRLVVRPSYEVKRYDITQPDGGTFTVRNNGFYLHFGASMNIPEIPRSPIGNDKTQVKHYITDPISGKKKEFRGQPFFKKQNPKVGELYQKMKKYKGSNKPKRRGIFK